MNEFPGDVFVTAQGTLRAMPGLMPPSHTWPEGSQWHLLLSASLEGAVRGPLLEAAASQPSSGGMHAAWAERLGPWPQMGPPGRGHPVWHVAQGGAEGPGARGAHPPAPCPPFRGPRLPGVGKAARTPRTPRASCAGSEELSRGPVPRAIPSEIPGSVSPDIFRGWVFSILRSGCTQDICLFFFFFLFPHPAGVSIAGDAGTGMLPSWPPVCVPCLPDEGPSFAEVGRCSSPPWPWALQAPSAGWG